MKALPVIAASLVTCFGLGAATTTVSTGPQLQSAIQSASAGDTILLNDGTYTVVSAPGSVAFDVLQSITIRSINGASHVVLSGASLYITVRIGTNNVVLDGVTISGSNGFGVDVTDWTNTHGGVISGIVLRNLVVSASGTNSQGIALNANNSVIELCTVSNTDFHGVSLFNANWNLVINNTIQNTGANGDGVAAQLSDHNVIAGNAISNTGFDGVFLIGSQYNYVALNSITAPHNGVTLTNNGSPARQSNRNYVGNNLMVLSNKDGSDGIWFNNDSDWNAAFSNDATGANENGMALFNAVGNYIRGNVFHQNPQGGVFVATISGTGTNTVPVNNSIQRNYLFYHGSNGGVITAGAGATDVGFNFIAGNPSQINIPIGGFLIQGTANTNLYANVVQTFYEGENIDSATTNTSLFLNRYFNVLNHYTFTGAAVRWDSGSTVLGGNFFSDFPSANGNPSNGSTPYTNILNNNNPTNNRGVYADRYPYASESLGKMYGVTVNLPAAGTSLAAGSQKTLNWTSQGCVLVDLNLLNASNNAISIASNYADYGYYRWTVPAVVSGAYRIQVICKNSGGATVGASAVGPQFNITSSDLILLSPQRDQIADSGQTLWISWRKSANVTQPVNVNIRYSDSGTYTSLLAGVTNDFVALPVPAASSNKVSIQIVSGSFVDSTDGWMTIRNGNGRFTSPAAATTFYAGTVYPIEWVGPPGSDYVNIDLIVGSSTKNIVTGLADFGRYDMLAPDFPGSGYLRLSFYTSGGNLTGTAQSAASTIQTGTSFGDDQPPSVVSVTPSSGSGGSATFTVTAADPNGFADLTSAVLLINGSLTGTGGCFVSYNRAANSVYLANDSASAWLGPSALGSGAALGNSQCTVNPASGSLSAIGNSLSVNLPVTFRSGFNGVKSVWGQATDSSGLTSGYQLAGSWTAAATGASKIGVYNNTSALFLLDANGNFAWDGSPPDKLFSWGAGNHSPRYVIVVGDWNGSGTRKAGIFDPATATWILDYNGDGVYTPGVDKLFQWGSPGDIPVVGDWNGSGSTKVGIFNPTRGQWLLDYNGNFTWDGAGVDKYFAWGSPGDKPVVGDWNGSGTTKVGTFGPATGLWLLDYNGNFTWDGAGVDKYFPWGSPGDTPVVGDWNGSGTTKVGTVGPTTGLWLLDYNGNFTWDGAGVDKYFAWGSPGDTPLVGDWNGSGTAKVGTFGPGSALWLLDYNGTFTWDGASVDKYFAWGSPGDTPVVN